MTPRAIENAEFDIRDTTEQDSSHGNGMSKHPGNQDQDIDYEIIMEQNEPLVEPNWPLMESNETYQNEDNPSETLDDTYDEDADGDLKHETTGT